MSSLIRTLQKRILTKKGAAEVPDFAAIRFNEKHEPEQPKPETRFPFGLNQIAFYGEQRITKVDQLPERYRPRMQAILDA